MLFSGRKGEANKIAREAAGQSLWSPVFTQPSRVKMIYAVYEASPVERFRVFVLETAQSLLGREYGVTSLAGGSSMVEDLLAFIRVCPDEKMPDVIEAICSGLMKASSSDSGYYSVNPHKFHDDVNEMLRIERISYELVEGKMIDFESRELFDSVVLPTITLLAGKRGWERVEIAYSKALDEISRDPGDAITDVTTALQQALELRHCDGNSLGELAKSGVKRKILTEYDAKLIDWGNADRGRKGDAHQSPDASRSDAWLVVHVVGALLLRLASGDER